MTSTASRSRSAHLRRYLLAALAVLLLLPAAAHAFSFSITTHTKRQVGSSRLVNLAGSYLLSVGEERLEAVRIVTLDAGGNFLSSAKGSFTTSTWEAGVGDFQLVFYYVEFTVKTATGRRTFKTQTFRW
jgi:hypothetical protein